MYPIKMKISGIRDFLPREMDLGEDYEHVLIGGKNGSGKSTLVYAMSYSLVSGRVDIDGLRSKNLRRDTDPWRAYVSILFRNPAGESQCDAPEYVELAVDIRSVAGRESIKPTYILSGGELPDKLIRLKKFPSNDDARSYYKRVFNIDADGYFMFWHQGAIARFANMSDQERFKQVAEMFGLDQIQQEWIEAQKQMTQAEEEFSNARYFASVQQRRLQELETRKNILEQRNNDRRDALARLTAYLVELAELSRTEWKSAEEEWDNLSQQYQQAEYELTDLEKQLEEAEDKLGDEKFKQENLTLSRQSIIFSIMRKEVDLDGLKKERNLLNDKIADIRERMQGIRRSKSDLLIEKSRLQEVMGSAEESINKYKLEQAQLIENFRVIVQSITILEEKCKQLDLVLKELKELDQRLPNEIFLTNHVVECRKEFDELIRKQQNIASNIENLQKEHGRLSNQKTLLLPEQEQLLGEYHLRGIEAVAFGELFEVRGDADRESIETIFNPLKHTLFVNRLLNDLPLNKAFYVVAIDEHIKSLPELDGSNIPIFAYLQMVSQVQETLSPGFLRGIMNWLQQIVLNTGERPSQCTGMLTLWNGNLWDSFGVRGPVESGDAIGIRAIENARKKVLASLAAANKELEDITPDLADAENRLNQTRKELEQRQQVNNDLPITTREFIQGEQELPQVRAQEENIREKQKNIGDEILAKTQERDNAERLLNQVNGEILVYEEFEKQAEDINRYNELEKEILEIEVIIEQEVFNRDELTDKIDEIGRTLPGLTNTRDTLQAGYSGKDQQLNQLDSKKTEAKQKADDLQDQAEQWKTEHEQLDEEYKIIISGLQMTNQWIITAIPDKEKENKETMERRIREAKSDLQIVQLKVVDEKAKENYDLFLSEFETAKKQMLESELRFANLKKEEEQRRDRFNKAVYMRWERTNQLFSKYMQQLGLVGQIRSIPPDENERNPQYKWELHVATQVGHKLEKVEPESAKRVGKGISGGERAATSLIFALSLLSDIENKPPFYVLDEFDSALDEERKHQLFDMYKTVLSRKLIIVSPKIHGDQYLNRFGKFHCVVANPSLEPGKNISEVYDVSREQYVQMPLDDDDESANVT